MGGAMNGCQKVVSDVFSLVGDVAEVGVGKGYSAAKLCEWFPDKTVHLYDTFSGMPGSKFSEAIDGGCNKPGKYAYSEDCIRQTLRAFGNFETHPGVFSAANGTFCLVHCDVDYYQSTHDVYEAFWPLLVDGGIIVCDDYGYGSCPGAKRAVDEFVKGITGHEAWTIGRRHYLRKNDDYAARGSGDVHNRHDSCDGPSGRGDDAASALQPGSADVAAGVGVAESDK